MYLARIEGNCLHCSHLLFSKKCFPFRMLIVSISHNKGNSWVFRFSTMKRGSRPVADEVCDGDEDNERREVVRGRAIGQGV